MFARLGKEGSKHVEHLRGRAEPNRRTHTEVVSKDSNTRHRPHIEHARTSAGERSITKTCKHTGVKGRPPKSAHALSKNREITLGAFVLTF